MARNRATHERDPKPERLSGPVTVLRGMAWQHEGTMVTVTCPDGHQARYSASKHGDCGRVTCECGYESDVVLDGLE